MHIAPLVNVNAWHDKVSIQVTLPAFGLLVVDRNPAQARRLAAELNAAAAKADEHMAAQALDPAAVAAAFDTIDTHVARVFTPRKRAPRNRATQPGSALRPVIDIMAFVGVAAGTIGFALRALFAAG